MHIIFFDLTSYFIDHATVILLAAICGLVFLITFLFVGMFALGWHRYPPSSGE